MAALAFLLIPVFIITGLIEFMEQIPEKLYLRRQFAVYRKERRITWN